jgi:uncharacterized FlaG/YvyC family protein
MASDGIPVNEPVTRLVHGGRAQTSETALQASSGTSLPPGGKTAPAGTPVVSTAQKVADSSALVAQLNQRLNDSGRPFEFRLDTAGGRNVIQQVNPASGDVVAEYPEAEFPILAEGLSSAGYLVNTRA